MGLKAHAAIQTAAAYQSTTDTVTLTVGSAAVVGAGTAWTSGITGRSFYRPGDTSVYTVTYVSATALTLDRPYESNGADAAGVVYAGAAHVFMTAIYALPSDCRDIVTVLNPITNLPLTAFSKDELDASAGQRTRVGDPAAYAAYDSTPEASPPVLAQIEFFPPPLRARGFALEYERVATAFSGSNTSAAPLPFVSDAVLLAGARSAIQLHLGNLAAAAGYQRLFDVELARLLKVEHNFRRTKEPLRMAGRFTRHRLARAARGVRTGWRGGQLGGPN